MVTQHEARSCRMSQQMFNLSKSQSGAPEVERSTTTIGNSIMEMGTYHDGFYCGVGYHSKGLWVIVGRLTKITHFLLIKIQYNLN